MTLQTFVAIILWSLGIVFTIAILLITYLLGRHSIRDNPDNGVVFIKTGRHVDKPYKAKRYQTSEQGSTYKYGNSKFVLVPASYDEVYYRNRRLIFVDRIGQLIASPFTGDIKLTENEKENLIYELVSSSIGADSIRALKGLNGLNSKVLMIAVIAFIVGAGLVYMVTNVLPKMQSGNTPTAIQQPATIPTQQPIEIK